MVFTKEDEAQFEAAAVCHICKNDFVRAHAHCHNEFEDELTCVICRDNYNADIIVRDHCHILGYFRGAAHQKCNLDYNMDRWRWKLPIFFHNLRGYDGHLLVRAVKDRHGKVRVIPTNMERYLAVSIGRVQFLDSFQFTMTSLENFVETTDDEDFLFTKQMFPTDEKFYLVRKKGVFPFKAKRGKRFITS